MKFIFYINWWVGSTCLGLLSSATRALYHMFLSFFVFTNPKFWSSFKRMIILSSAKGEVLKKKISRCVQLWGSNAQKQLYYLPSTIPPIFRTSRWSVVMKWTFYLNNRFTLIYHIWGLFFEKNIEKSISRTCENYFLYKLVSR